MENTADDVCIPKSQKHHDIDFCAHIMYIHRVPFVNLNCRWPLGIGTPNLYYCCLLNTLRPTETGTTTHNAFGLYSV